MSLILASNSAARKAILTGAGVAFAAQGAEVDEAAEKTRLLAEGAGPADVAQALAGLKALAVSRARPGAWVLGSDQTLEFQGRLFDKAASAEEAGDRLRMLRGHAHQLHSGVALARDGHLDWTGRDSARLHVREVSEDFLTDYLAAEGEALTSCVGGYRLEGLGAQLFERVEGDYFTVLGMPLWPVLAALRERGVIAL
ncbi:Maf family protein [Brevundimonas lutea]|uniref:Maf family protein n=1 Tax=Brevundimonas lutea TaxID=2293980 RepID=UPI000F0159C3|nr:Maf family protein [Brevundimonas lutea]